jgi:hypothetical protein
MRRLFLLLKNELKLTRTALPINLVAIFQPALMFSLMAYVLVMPTFKMNLQRPAMPEGEALLRVMEQVGSPVGADYIQPVVIDWEPTDPIPNGQIVVVDFVDDAPTATQIFGLIDSNMVKNFRNRMTSAALLLWEKRLQSKAVVLRQRPLLPRDVSYRVYFGMAMLPLAAYIGGAFVGAFLTAQEFEFKTIREYRLAPAPWQLVIVARLLRLCLNGMVSVGALAVVMYLFDRVVPSSIGVACLLLMGMSLIGASVGTCAALILRSTLPAFVIGLTSAFFTWIMGGAFGLPAGFGGAYEAVSRWMPNTYAVNALYRLYYPVGAALRCRDFLILGIFASVAVGVVMLVYRQVVLRTEAVGW